MHVYDLIVISLAGEHFVGILGKKAAMPLPFAMWNYWIFLMRDVSSCVSFFPATFVVKRRYF